MNTSVAVTNDYLDNGTKVQRSLANEYLRSLNPLQVLDKAGFPVKTESPGKFRAETQAGEILIEEKEGKHILKNALTGNNYRGIVDMLSDIKSENYYGAAKWIMENFNEGLKAYVQDPLNIERLENMKSTKEQEYESIKAATDKLKIASLRDYLLKSGYSTKEKDKNVFRVNGDSVNVNPFTNAFYNHTKAFGGYGIVSFEMKNNGLSFPQAVKTAGEKIGQFIEPIKDLAPLSPEDAKKVAAKEPLTTPPDPIEANLPHVLDYLYKRGLDQSAITALVKTGAIYADAAKNAVFKLSDPNGKGEYVGALLRGTVPMSDGSANNFKRVYGSKGFSDLPPVTKKEGKTVMFVESPIEALAARALGHRCRIVGTCGEFSKEKLSTFIGTLPVGTTLVAAFNKDTAGKNLQETLFKVAETLGFKTNSIEPTLKDFALDSQRQYQLSQSPELPSPTPEGRSPA